MDVIFSFYKGTGIKVIISLCVHHPAFSLLSRNKTSNQVRVRCGKAVVFFNHSFCGFFLILFIYLFILL